MDDGSANTLVALDVASGAHTSMFINASDTTTNPLGSALHHYFHAAF
ncbi:MAG: hypothetical protein WA744_11745 [Candidatus Acidiferrales bacterium]